MNRGTSEPSSSDRDVVLFFDGVCGLCNRTVDFVLRYDCRGVVRFAPLQGRTARERLSVNDLERLDSVVLQQNGISFRKSSAVVKLLQAMGGVWSVLGLLLWLIPRPLRDVCYGFIARNRYRVFGQKLSCRMPSPEERNRFCE